MISDHAVTNPVPMKKLSTLIPSAVLQVLGEPPLVSGEDPAAYESLLGQLGVESGAQGTIEWLWVKDIADLTWQIHRIRRWLRIMIESGHKMGLAMGIDQLLSRNPTDSPSAAANKLAHEAYSDMESDEHGRDGEARLSALLEPYGLEMEHIGAAHSFFRQFKTISDAEDLITKLESRRDRALAQIETRRFTLGSNLRTTLVMSAAPQAQLDHSTVPQLDIGAPEGRNGPRSIQAEPPRKSAPVS
jgi:hypothetical protein